MSSYSSKSSDKIIRENTGKYSIDDVRSGSTYNSKSEAISKKDFEFFTKIAKKKTYSLGQMIQKVHKSKDVDKKV